MDGKSAVIIAVGLAAIVGIMTNNLIKKFEGSKFIIRLLVMFMSYVLPVTVFGLTLLILK